MGTAHAQGDRSTAYSTSTSIASGKEGFVLTDTFADVEIEGDVDVPGSAAAGAVAGAANADGFGQAFSESLAASDEDFQLSPIVAQVINLLQQYFSYFRDI